MLLELLGELLVLKMLLFEVLMFFECLDMVAGALIIQPHKALVDQVLNLSFEMDVLSQSLLHGLGRQT